MKLFGSISLVEQLTDRLYSYVFEYHSVLESLFGLIPFYWSPLISIDLNLSSVGATIELNDHKTGASFDLQCCFRVGLKEL